MKKFGKIMVALLALACLVGACFAFTACNKGNNVKIGAQQGTTGSFYVKGNADMNFSGYSNIDCKEYESIAQAAMDMKNGNIDFVIGDIAPALSLVESVDGLKVIDIALSTEQYAIGVDPKQTDLLNSINEILAEMKSNGKLEEIMSNYNDADYEPAGYASPAQDSGKEQLVMVTEATFNPFEYMIGDKYAGIDVEIALYIAEQLGQELVIINTDFDSVVPSVGKNGVDIAIAGLTITETRKQSVTFSAPYYEGAYQVLIVKADDTTFDECVTKEDVENILKSL